MRSHAGQGAGFISYVHNIFTKEERGFWKVPALASLSLLLLLEDRGCFLGSGPSAEYLLYCTVR